MNRLAIYADITAGLAALVGSIWVLSRQLTDDVKYLLISIILLGVTVVVMWVGDRETISELELVATRLERISTSMERLALDVERRASFRPKLVASFLKEEGANYLSTMIPRGRLSQIRIRFGNAGTAPAEKASWTLFFPPWFKIGNHRGDAKISQQPLNAPHPNHVAVTYPFEGRREFVPKGTPGGDIDLQIEPLPSAPGESKVPVNGDCANAEQTVTQLLITLEEPDQAE